MVQQVVISAAGAHTYYACVHTVSPFYDIALDSSHEHTRLERLPVSTALAWHGVMLAGVAW